MICSEEKIAHLSTSRLTRKKKGLNTKEELHTLRARVYDFIIKDGKSLTQLEAWGLFGCGDLRTAIRDIRKQLKKSKSKYRIKTVKNKDVRGRLYGRYYRQLIPAT